MIRNFLLLLSLLAFAHAASLCPAVVTCLEAIDAGKKCPLLPVPGRSPNVPLGPLGFNLTELRRGVYWYSDNGYSSLILYKSRRLALVDFPNSAASISSDGTYLLTTATMQVLNGETPRRIDMIYGHRHTDHIGQAGTYYKFLQRTFPDVKTLIWGTTETRKFLGRIPNTDVPLPKIIVGKKGRTVNLGSGLDIKLLLVGGHTNQDLIALVPTSKDGPGVAHYVDMIWPGGSPFISFALTIDLGRYITAQEHLLGLNFEFYSGGHGPLGTKPEIKTNIEYTRFVVKAAREASNELDQGKIRDLAERVKDPTDPAFENTQWPFIVSFEMQGAICERKVIERWGCELYGVDNGARSHCLAAVFYNFIDQ